MLPDRDLPRSKKFLKSFVYAFHGLRLLSRERNFRIQLVLAAIAVALVFVLDLDGIHAALIVVCIALVLGGEAVNSSAERLLNVVSPEHREEVREIKDGMAAAVLIFSVAAVAIGLWVFGNALASY